MTILAMPRTKTLPFEHQRVGTAALVKNAAFALFDEPGAGKSKQVIDAACQLAERGKIDTVVVVAPASVRCVWLDAEIGEIKKHSYLRNFVYEFRKDFKLVWEDPFETPQFNLCWIVTNYEWLRSSAHLEKLIGEVEQKKALLVLDESSYIKSRTAQQTKAVKKLRQVCARCVLLNGTPIANSPLDLWSQMQVLDPRILKKKFKNYYHFRSEYCELRNQSFAGRTFKVVQSYRRLDDLAAKLAPYVLRREKKDCLDLPPKLYTEREIPLTVQSWQRYCELRQEAVVALGNGNLQLEPNAAVRIMRLAQLTSGILGGGQIWNDVENNIKPIVTMSDAVQDVSDEKLRWIVEYLIYECTAKAVIMWCRWRRERERLVEVLRREGSLAVFQLYGGQRDPDREHSIRNFTNLDERIDNRRAVLIAQPHAGGHGLNLVAASEAIYLSNDFSLGIRLQSEDRCHRPGQVNRVLYTDVLATGPKGQKTIDHVIFKALREKRHLAMMTCAEWRKELDCE